MFVLFGRIIKCMYEPLFTKFQLIINFIRAILAIAQNVSNILQTIELKTQSGVAENPWVQRYHFVHFNLDPQTQIIAFVLKYA